MQKGDRLSTLIHLSFLSSIGNGPAIRVPAGFMSGVSIIAALSENLILLPSFRWISARVRTTNARITSPFLNLHSPLTSRTLAVTMSPIPPIRFFFLCTPITRISFTPVLSTTASFDIIWIILKMQRLGNESVRGCHCIDKEEKQAWWILFRNLHR